MKQYYHIKDLNTIGKVEDGRAFIYDKQKGWVPDSENRLIGYKEAPNERKEYIMSAPPVLTLIQEISEENAKRYINSGMI